MAALEIISRYPTGATRDTPLLFVHGAFCAAWIWDVHFLPWFAERGWEVHAVSLRGHGNSEGTDQLNSFGIADYVSDVVQAASHCSTSPLLIGHSMGGFVVQRALARLNARGAARPSPGGVLMASVPPHGLFQANLGLAWRAPELLQQMGILMTLGTRFVDERAMRKAMFSSDMPADEARKYDQMMQLESCRVMMDLGGWLPFPVLPPPSTPMLVLGAEDDMLVPASEIRSTAQRLGTTARLYPRMGHAMMLEKNWLDVAQTIDEWASATIDRCAVAAD